MHMLLTYTTISEDVLLNLITFCLTSSYFIFEEQYYEQIFGLAMGNPLSPICADLVLSTLQETCLAKLSFYIPFYKRYVDDIITAIPREKDDEILNTFNEFHQKIRFTVENEVEQKISFLDTLLIRNENNVIITDWYLKPTNSERYLNFYSNHSFKQKINIIKNLTYRAINLSNVIFHKKNIDLIKKFLKNNNYPEKLLTQIINEVTHNTGESNNNPRTKVKKTYFKIPYINSLSEKLSRALTNDDISIAYKNENTISQYYTRLKSHTPKFDKSNVVYEISCNYTDCNSVYIGQTKRYLKERMKEHEYDVKTSKNINKTTHTALVEHILQKPDHNFDFDNCRILGAESNLKKRLLLEMIEIKKNKNSVNKRTDIESLNSIYFSILEQNNNFNK